MIPIIHKLGGRDVVFEKLRKRQCDVETVDALRMWESRGVIPGKYVPEVMAIAEKDGVSYEASDFQETHAVAITKPKSAPRAGGTV